VTKIVGVWPLARMHYMHHREATDRPDLRNNLGPVRLPNKLSISGQYTILVTVVILSAFVPTLFAQKFFQPTKGAMHAWGRRYRQRLGVLSVEDSEDEPKAD